MKVYQYLAKPPCTDAAVVDRQLRLAVEYQRALIAVEVRRREAVEALYVTALPEVHARAREAELAVDAAVMALRTVRAGRLDDALSRTALLAARDHLAAVREAKRVARKGLTPAIRDALRSVDATARAESKVTYNAPEHADLAWGTKLAVAESVERAAKASAVAGTLPKLPTYDGSGSVAVQLQGGLDPAELASDTRFRLESVDQATWLTRCEEGRQHRIEAQRAEGFVRRVKARRVGLGHDGRPLPAPREEAGQYAVAHLRVGSVGCAPVWASWPVRVSRPLPARGKIKWARMHARRVGTRVEWRLLVTVDEPAVVERGGDRVLAVNLGWRNLGDGQIRVAYAVGSDGREEQVLVPERFLSKTSHVEHLRSTRDQLCDAAVARLRAWVADRSLPEWFAEATRHVPLWHGPKQVSRLLREWEKRRFPGDEEVFDALASWRNGKDARGHSTGNHHLRFWEMDEREKALRHRNEVYRQVARRWARDYDLVIVTDMDLRDFAKEVVPEDGPRSEGARQRSTRTLAGPSILRREAKNAFASRGGRFIEERGAWTQTCAACGVVEEFDAAKNLVRTCGTCGDVSDQDRNHCVCMLASAEVARKRAEDLALSVSVDVAAKKAGRWGRRRSQTVAKVVEKTAGLR